MLQISHFIKCSEKCARRDWSAWVPYVSIKHVPYVTRVHCWDIYNASSLRHRYERAQFTIHFIKEIKSLVPRALLRYISTCEFLRTRRLVLLRSSLVFLKIHKCLYVSTMHSVRFLFLISHHPVETFYQICHKLNQMFETSGRLGHA